MSRRLNSFEKYSQMARGEISPAMRQVIPPPASPSQQITETFPYQSYFSDSLLEKALIQQLPNNQILYPKTVNTPGYSLGLHPASDTPVAVKFTVGGKVPDSAVHILAPGQVIRPFGRPSHEEGTPFSGFTWGLPYGWLGGGTATLLAFPSPDANVAWNCTPEIIFHRMRMRVYPVASAPASLGPKNWPLHFPWINATSGSDSFRQGAQPTITVTPTKALMSLRLTSLASAAAMYFLIQGSNDFDFDSSMNPVTASVRSYGFTWGSYAVNGAAGPFGTAYPIDDVPNQIVRLAGDKGSLILLDGGSGLLNSAYVDIVRYGRVG